ncbi:Crp/Fnr family transcriptional regulator [Helicobacter burdigaliensis]|uniref:Crp/Fnr family transcriptional regulator n=1 Tax=Helicobacter burdigaliensis TaxID=2315334 RepID=UPI000EF6F271|nr:Crp/Fnr family transcriptional regulator [Helicobacter burdigaliensis]
MQTNYLEILCQKGYKKHYSKGEIVFFEGQIPKKLFILVSGNLRIYKNTQKEITLHKFSPPSLIAEMPTFLSLPYPASCECESDCEIAELSLNDFKTLLKEDNDFNFLLIASLLNKIKILEELIIKNSLKLENRLARFLINHQNSLHTLTQKSIATSLNTSQEALSRIIKGFKSKGYLATKKGKIEILDKQALLLLLE